MKYRIFADKGRFESVKEAAFSEKQIDFDDPFDATACTECFVAEDMAEILKTKKGLDISIGGEGDALIFLGKSLCKKACEKYGIDFYEVTDTDGYRLCIKTAGNIKIVLIYGENRRGTIYGASSFMELHGIRFISPGIDGTHYREELDLSNTTDYDITESPSFKTREGFSSFISDERYDFFMWLFHNKFNTVHLKYGIRNPEFFKKLGFNISGGAHDIWYKYMDINHEYPYKHKIFGGDGKPDDPYEVSPLYMGDANGDEILTYGEAHPEWFAESGGKHRLFRDYKYYNEIGYCTGDFICTSNEDATDEFIKLFVESLISGDNRHLSELKFYALDNGTWCDCEKCRKDESLSYRMLMLAYKLDKAIKKATIDGRIKRKIYITTPAYHETLTPPDKPLPDDFDYDTISIIVYVIERCYAHDINDPVCTETNAFLLDRLKDWVSGHYKGEITIGEYFNVSSFSAMPFILTERIANDIPFYHSTGARHMHYMHMTAGHWGVSAINNYLYGKLMWNTGYDAGVLKNEYFLSRYGKHASKMAEIYKELERACANSKLIKHYQLINGEKRSIYNEIKENRTDIFDSAHIGFKNRSEGKQAGPSFTETVERFEKILKDFEEYSKNYDMKSFDEDRNQLNYGYNMLMYIYLNTKAVLEGKTEEIERLTEMYAKKLENETISLSGYDYGNMYKNGLSATFMLEGR